MLNSISLQRGRIHRSLWSGMWPIKNAACSLHVHCVSRKKNRTTKSRIAINSLTAFFPPFLIHCILCHSSLSVHLFRAVQKYQPPLLLHTLLKSALISFISYYNMLYEQRVKLLPSKTDEKITRSLASHWQATAIPSSLLLMIINYISLANMPWAILPHLLCAIEFTFWILFN